MTPALRLSLTSWRATPPKQPNAFTCAPIQSGSAWLQVAQAKVKLDAPSTATKTAAWRSSPLAPSMTAIVLPA